MADTTANAITLQCSLAPLDTWFFRESRPHGSVGASELGSVFPPPVRTLAGALRTCIGDAWFANNGSNWQEFARDAHHPLRAIIGFGNDLGALRITGAFLSKNSQRLFPAPANLMSKENGAGKKTYFLLRLGHDAVHCDLGRVHLPCMPESVPGLTETAGSKPAEGAWLTEEGWRSVLAGRAPDAGHVIAEKNLFDTEQRLGIGRDASRRATVDGLLYQTRHLRLCKDVAVELLLGGLDAATAALLPGQSIVRLGGEGRAAALSVHTLDKPPALPGAGSTLPAGEAVLYTLSPTPCTGELPAGIPEGFERIQDADGTHTWRGTLGGHAISILCAVCQRPVREGGWNLARHRALPVRSLLPAGSALYVRSEAPLHAGALHTLADAWGRGLITAGKMP